MKSAAPHTFTLRQLQYALAVREALSFRKAAERCHVSQPSLSAQLSELEASLGVRLFERDRRRVLVTSVGREILERAQAVLIAADDLSDAVQRLSDPTAGTLTVGVIPTIAPYLLPRLTRALRQSLPRLTINWVEDKTETLVHRLQQGSLDAALLALEADVGDVEHQVVEKDPFVLVAPRGHALMKKKGPVDVAELREQSVLLLDDGHCFREQALEVCSSARARELAFRATSLPTLVQMVAQGVGVTLLPAMAVATEAERFDLGVRRFRAPAPERTVALVWRHSSPLGETLKRVALALKG